MAAARTAQAARPPTRLYLVTPRLGDAQLLLHHVESALDAGEVAAVLLRVSDQDLRTAAATLGRPVQSRGVALLLDARPDLVASFDADGCHLMGAEALERALPILKPDRIAGVGGLKTRHDAMIAAESGADYVMFGEPDAAGLRPGFAAVLERVAWWAELFEVPCVAYAASFEEVGPLAAGGADFIALGDWAWAGEPAAAVKAAAAAIKPTEEVE